MLPVETSPVLPVEPVTELTEGAVETPLVVLTNLNVVLRVTCDETAGAAKTNKV